MLMIPIIALIFLGGSYFFANRCLPPKLALKATPWMAGVALISYFAMQFLAALITGIVLGLVALESSAVITPLLILISILGAIAGATLVLRGFMKRHQRRKADKEAHRLR